MTFHRHDVTPTGAPFAGAHIHGDGEPLDLAARVNPAGIASGTVFGVPTLLFGAPAPKVGATHQHDAQVIGGAHVHGIGGLGVLGRDIPEFGQDGGAIIFDDLVLPDDNDSEIRWAIEASSGFSYLAAFEDGSVEFILSGATASLTYRLWQDGVDLGTSDIDLDLSIGATLVVAESGDDTFASAAEVGAGPVAASVTVVETGDDVFAAAVLADSPVGVVVAITELDDVFAAAVATTSAPAATLIDMAFVETGDDVFAATAAVGPPAGSYVSDVVVDEDLMIQAGVTVRWTWVPGRIGALAGVELIDGISVTNGAGVWSASVPLGEGFMLAGANGASAADDDVWYQPASVE